jgi:hypothetical protein
MSKFDDFNFVLLKDLFEMAKDKDEFEFCCTLLRVRGLESAGWDTLEESHSLINNIITMMSAPIDTLFRIRLSLLLYCHITEMDDFYKIIGNLLWILTGKRYCMDPFYYTLYPDRKAANNPESKVKRIKEISSEANIPLVGELYEYLLVRQVRNAFFHSDYTLFNNEFHIVNGEGVLIDGIITKVVPLDWIFSRIELMVNVMIEILRLLRLHRESYIEDKIVKGRMSYNESYVDIVLMADETGLYGIRSNN